MKLKLGAGWASSNRPRRRWWPSLSRRARIAIVVAVIAVTGAALATGAWWAISSVYRSRELLAARTKITPESIQQSVEWDGPWVVPLARLAHSLSRPQLRRMALSGRHRISYYALSASQRQDFREAFAVRRSNTESLWQMPPEWVNWRPAYFYFAPCLPGMPHGVVARLAISYAAPGRRGEAGAFGVDVYSPLKRPLAP